jgi:hypothetical protein
MKPSSRRTNACLVVALLAFCWGNVRPASAQSVSVTSASPSSAAQGTVNLNITVNGKGFKRNATAQWFLTGTTNPGGVTVNSTAFVSSSELTANISVDSNAVVSGYDIVVTNTNASTGKGTELFSVLSSNSSAGNLSMTIVDFPSGFTPDVTHDGVNGGVYTDHDLTGSDTCVSATVSSNDFTQIQQNYLISTTHRKNVWCNQSLARPRFWNIGISDSTACGHLGLASPCTVGPDVSNTDYERILPGNAFCSSSPSVEFQFTLNGTGYSVRTDGSATITQGSNSCTLTYSGNSATAKFYQSGTAISGSFPFEFQLTLEKF